jgi:hypothetical protein
MLKHVVFSLVSVLVFTPILSFAAPTADLQVSLTGPANAPISVASTYTVQVKNLGAATANGNTVVIEFPLTNTSPSVSILGTVSGLNTNCSLANNKVTCQVPSLKKGKTANVTFSYTPPVSTKVLELKAVGATATGENITANNTARLVPSLSYPSRPLTSGTMLNSHCTGQALTSYFECLLYPSSIATHTVDFTASGTIAFSDPAYTGTWSQTSGVSQLHFEYFENGDKVLEFNGRAINGANCFDGLSQIFPTGNYVSPYRVCVQ